MSSFVFPAIVAISDSSRVVPESGAPSYSNKFFFGTESRSVAMLDVVDVVPSIA